MRERRQNVRVRPSADYDIRVELVSGLVTVPLSVVDVAIGGMGLLVDQMFQAQAVGSELTLRITFPGHGPFETQAELRHNSGEVGGKCGVALIHLSHEQTHALRTAVGELQERGHSA